MPAFRFLPVVALIMAGCAVTPPLTAPDVAPPPADVAPPAMSPPPTVVTHTAALGTEDVPIQTASTPSTSPTAGGSPMPCPSASASTPACGRYGENPTSPPIEPIVTFAKYDQVTVGMTYEQVVALFGRSGENTFWFRIEEQSSARYHWRNADASYAEIWFTNDHVSAKTNVDLR